MSFIVRWSSAALASILMPWVMLRSLRDPRFGETLYERSGSGGWLDIVPGEEEIIWIHAASVGEVAGIAPLAKSISELYPQYRLVISTTSTTGREEVIRRGLTDTAVLAPLDHPVYVRRTLDAVRPKLVIIAETELWPNFLCALASRQIPTILVNARISAYTFPKYSRFRFFTKRLLAVFSHIGAQTALDAERFIALGADAARVSVTGSTKYSLTNSSLQPREREEFAKILGIDPSRPCFVAGSVRSGEDEIVVAAFVEAKAAVPELQMIIAPRHQERFVRAGAILERYGLKFVRRSWSGPKESADVVLLDTIGELSKAYSLGSFAFVGGSLVDIGGHNPFEPCTHRLPVIMGPYVANVQEAAEELSRAGALMSVAGQKQLVETIVLLAKNSDATLLRGAKGYEIWRKHSQAVESVLPLVAPYLEQPVSAANRQGVS